jgi:thymidylate synthase (FAD)
MKHLWIIELEALEVSAKGKNIIQKLIKGENISPDDSGLSKREWNELMEAFELKDKLI